MGKGIVSAGAHGVVCVAKCSVRNLCIYETRPYIPSSMSVAEALANKVVEKPVKYVVPCIEDCRITVVAIGTIVGIQEPQ